MIDLNADLGEGFGRWTLTDDDALLTAVTSANVACGYHAGDPVTMRRVCEVAVASGVAIGAQVSYHDLVGFGRRPMEVPTEELAAEVAYQVGALGLFAKAAGGEVVYVKPHGALYNRVAYDQEQAAAVVEGVMLASTVAGVSLAVLGLAGSTFLEIAEGAGLPAIPEAFADRAYLADGTLAPRGVPGAVIHDPVEVVSRAIAIAHGRAITAIDGTEIVVEALSVCVHGDTPGAPALAARVREGLEEAGLDLRSFA